MSTRETNIAFQEAYKQLDRICKDMYRGAEGVSAYIKDMENTPLNLRKNVYGWDVFYRELKRKRWMRNQLAHDVDIDMYFCTFNDIDWVERFHEKILKCEDPIALAYKGHKAKIKTKEITGSNAERNSTAQKRRPSLWSRFVSKIKNLFG